MNAAQRLKQVVDRFGGIVLGGEQRSLLAHPDFKVGNERPRSFTAYGKPLLRRFAVNAALDLEQHVDTTHRLARDRRLSLFHQVENFLRPWLQHAASRIGAGFL